MLPNGYAVPDRGFVSSENTTAFDCLAYIISCRMIDNEMFKDSFMQMVHNSVTEFFTNYVNHRSQTTVLRSRSQALSNLFDISEKDEVKMMDCASTVYEISKRTWLSGTATNCPCKAIIDIPSDQIVFELPQCDKEHKLDDIIVFLNADGREALAVEPDGARSLPLISDAIMINDKIFVLNAIVKQTKVDEKNHYIVDIKRSNSKWYRFDNTAYSVKRIEPNDEEISVHMLCYVRDPVNIKQLSQSTSKSNNISIIENFHTVKIDGTKIKVINSCVPDSILHILCQVFREMPTHLTNLKPDGSLMNLLKAYISNDGQMVYITRVKLLMQMGFKLTQESAYEQLDAKSRIGWCLQKMLEQNLYSAKVIHTCGCGEKPEIVTIIDIDIKKLCPAGIKEPVSLLASRCNEQSWKCSDCKTVTKTTTELAALVFIGIMSGNGHIDCSLKDFPLEIQINSLQYALRGVLEYIQEERHFSAHCLLNGKFYEYNDLYEKIETSTEKPIEADVLVFVKC